MIIVQQVVYTVHAERWHALAESLGLTAFYPPSPDWGEFGGDGVLAVHRADDHRPVGAVDLNLLVDDLDAAERALAAYSVTRGRMQMVGDHLTVRTRSGAEISVFPGAVAVTGEVTVQPIWFHEDIAEVRGILEALGMRAAVVADRGGWVEMRADAGAVGVHSVTGRAEGHGPGVGLSFQTTGDLHALAARLMDAGFAASILDEAYGRSIRIPDPDGGADVCVNDAPTDLYGYHRED
ncbi:hypothetical protein ACFWHT_09050 [Microbacterium sp. NPDC058342]|uniref:hypothetical protein n=1 Tax=Microbacterium sp. NPDC058342 TaxID=3346454 RepID=UPI0036652CD4